jgi:outer membrane protein insertion porin family
MSSVKLAGQLLVPEEELTKLVQVKPGEVFSREKMTETTKAISERLGNEGYAFANVNAAPELDKEKRQVAFTVFIDPGRRVYVRRINVSGNTRTRDEVIRREMRQAESGWYDGEKINKSRTRVDRLGYFDDVTVETPPVAGTTDQVDMEIKVKEKPTGNIMLGAGFSSAEKVHPFRFGAAAEPVRQRQAPRGSGQHQQVEQGLLAITYRPLFHGRWRQPGLRYLHPQDRQQHAGGRQLRLGFDGRRTALGPSRSPRTITSISAFPTIAPRSMTDAQQPASLPGLRDAFGARSNTLLTTVGWQKDGRDSLLVTTSGVYRRAVLEVRAARQHGDLCTAPPISISSSFRSSIAS